MASARAAQAVQEAYQATRYAAVTYKTNMLKQVENGAPEVAFAYGDSTTNFKAYGNAGVPQAHGRPAW